MNSKKRNELRERIRVLEGLTPEERTALLGLLAESKPYGLVWEDKPEDVEERLRNELPVLRELPERALISPDPAAPNHILIEGDNIEALSTLAYTHEGKIDVIYIDPPYNTGNKDFVYNDSYVEKEDAYRHSKWLSFMAKRLRIAKTLLSERGVIFISIDDNEQAQLKLLCDEVFGEGNFVGQFFWMRTSTPPALSLKIRRKLEFVTCYQKANIPQRHYAQGLVEGGDAPLLNSGNPLATLCFPMGSVRFGVADGVYTDNGKYKIKLLDEVIVEGGTNRNAFRATGHFKWGQDNLQREVSEGTYFLIKTKQFSPRFQKSVKATKVPSNIVNDEVGVGTNEDAQKEINELGIVFDYAKPTTLIRYLIRMPYWEEKGITILDFFAGSGTTLHAVMQLNAEDGGHRQCILVTNNENGICEKVTYERNRRVIEGYTTPKGEVRAGLRGNTLRYYRTDFIPRSRTVKNMRQLVNLSTDMLCVKENIYREEATFGGVTTRKGVFRYFREGERQMLVVYREEVVEELAELIYDMEVAEPIIVYVFSPSEDAWSDEWDDVQEKVRPTALPAAILNTYKRVLPKRRDTPLETNQEEEGA